MKKGSLNDIQILVNKYPDLLNSKLTKKLSSVRDKINWVSPLEKDNYREFKDKEFIEKLELDLSYPLNDFWPNGGAHWDALAKSSSGQVVLLEAKANIPEIVSSPCAATAKESRYKIRKALDETRDYLNINNEADWMGKFYQYTNRIAHLYFLRVKNNIPAFLINLYFLNDHEVNGPKKEEEWKAALEVMKIYLGLKKHKLSKYMADVFIDVHDIKPLEQNDQ